MNSIAIEAEYVSSDGTRMKKVIKSQAIDGTIGNLVRNVKKKFDMEEELELMPKLKLTFLEPGRKSKL